LKEQEQRKSEAFKRFEEILRKKRCWDYMK